MRRRLDRRLVACAIALGVPLAGCDAAPATSGVEPFFAATRSIRPDPLRRSGAVLTDADLLAAAPAAAASAAPSADAPLPPEIVQALRPTPGNAPSEMLRELDLTFGDRHREIFETALDAASVLDEALPPTASVLDEALPPAAPAPDFP